MQLYCPSCQTPSIATDRCLRCGDRLITATEAYTPASVGTVVAPDPIRPTAPGRIAVGCVAALGLYLALREFTNTLATDPEWWTSSAGFVLACLVRGVGALGGGLLAGAGRRSGAITGLIVGLVFGGLLLLADAMMLGRIGPNEIGVAVGLAVLAGLAGTIGGWVWPPEAELPQAAPVVRRGSSLARLAADQKQELRGRPISWIRVLIGAVIVVAGVAGADMVRTGLKKETGGILNTGSPAQAGMVDLQIAALIALVGAVVAGGGTGAGVRHGVLAGGLAGLGVAVLGSGWTAPVVGGLFELLSSTPPGGTNGPMALALVVMLLCTAGGWFGGQIFPPLVPKHLRHRRIALS